MCASRRGFWRLEGAKAARDQVGLGCENCIRNMSEKISGRQHEQGQDPTPRPVHCTGLSEVGFCHIPQKASEEDLSF